MRLPDFTPSSPFIATAYPAGSPRTRRWISLVAATGLSHVLDVSTPGLLLDFYLLAPYVFLYYLRVLHNVLAHSDLFLDHRSLANHDLFLGKMSRRKEIVRVLSAPRASIGFVVLDPLP